jgi:hypothetical protein
MRINGMVIAIVGATCFAGGAVRTDGEAQNAEWRE